MCNSSDEKEILRFICPAWTVVFWMASFVLSTEKAQLSLFDYWRWNCSLFLLHFYHNSILSGFFPVIFLKTWLLFLSAFSAFFCDMRCQYNSLLGVIPQGHIPTIQSWAELYSSGVTLLKIVLQVSRCDLYNIPPCVGWPRIPWVNRTEWLVDVYSTVTNFSEKGIWRIC